MELSTIVLILVSLYIGWNIGANNAANCLGTSVGAGILSFRRAAILVGIFALIGASLQGGRTISTVGKGVVDPTALSQLSIICALLGAALLVTFFTKKGLPISTSQAVIGALAGIGLVTSTAVNWGVISKLFFAWILTPISAAFFSYIAYRLIAYFFRNFNLMFLEKKLYLAVIGSGIFLAYTLGANNIGNAMGLVVSTKIMGVVTAGFLGGIFLAIGSVSFGKNVMKTVGMKITMLDSWMAFAAQAGSAVTMYILTLLAIPASTSHAIVGGVAGVGVVKGVASIDKGEIFRIIKGWVSTPLLGGVLAVIIFKLFSFFI